MSAFYSRYKKSWDFIFSDTGKFLRQSFLKLVLKLVLTLRENERKKERKAGAITNRITEPFNYLFT